MTGQTEYSGETPMLRRSLAAAVFALAATGAMAQPYPPSGRAVTLIVPYPAGGGTDTMARLMASALEKELGGTFTVVNRVGAASQVGLSELVRAKPDGMTLAYAVLPTIVTHYLDPKRQAIYTRADFAPVFMHYITNMTLSVKTDSPIRNLKDLVDAARAKPGKITISDSGLLGTPHTTALMLAHVANVQFASVHFGGGPPSVTALLGGHVDVLAGGVGDALPQWKAGAFRVLGVASEEPDPAMPDNPTFRTQGFDVLSASIGAMVAPKGTPAAIVAKLSDAAKKIIADPEHTKKIFDLGSTPYYHDPEGTTKVWIDTEQRVKPLLAELQER